MPREPYYVQSLERGLAVIRAFDARHPEQTLSDVARACDLPRAAARRFLLTLTDLGYVRTDGRLFSLAPRVLELGHSYLSALSLPEIAEAHLRHLVAEVRESSSLSVLDGDDIVCVARVPTARIMRVAIDVGTRFPAYATSTGRVLLAALPDDDLEAYLARARLEPLTDRTVHTADALRAALGQVRRQSHAVVDQELEEGLRTIAAPVHDRAGHVTGAVGVSVHAARATVDEMRDRLLPPLLAATAAIETDLRIPSGRPAT